MVLEYSGRHLAMIELAAYVKLLLYVSLIGCMFVPFGIAQNGAGPERYLAAIVIWLGKLIAGGVLLGVFEMSIAKMRVFRVPNFLGAAFMLGLLGVLLLFVSQGM
jgi:formate hydrogenlyase subunit 4